MSDVVETTEPEVQTGAGSESLFREVAVSIASEGDGRTLVSRLVPYGEIGIANDGRGEYPELFEPGAFNAQMRAAHRIRAFLNYRHRQGLADVIGHLAKIEDRPDGLYGELRVLDTPDGDKALKLIQAGQLDRLSIEFRDMKSRAVNGVVRRVSARLLGVALCPLGVYQGAQVLAVREGDDVLLDDETSDVTDEPLERADELDPDLKARLARFVDMTTPPDVLERLDSLL